MLAKITSENIIIACLLTGMHDVNRNTVLQNDDYSLVKKWADSIIEQNLHGIIFHNNFSKETCKKQANQNIQFVRVNPNPAYNPNVNRYFIYNDFLAQQIGKIKNVFCTDISDVVLLKNPFIQPLFIQNPSSIFCGDEPKLLNNEWMLEHAAHLRKNINDYEAYEENFKNEQLLNCGIIGGGINTIQPFIAQLASLHQQYNQLNDTAFTGDMGAFNYLTRTKYNDRLKHGTPVNTVFKTYENSNKDCWFKHK